MTTSSCTTPRSHSMIEPPLEPSEINWLRLVEYYARSGSLEDRESLRALAKQIPEFKNPYLLSVSDAIQSAAQERFLNLVQLQQQAKRALVAYKIPVKLDQRHLKTPDSLTRSGIR